jgi:hypothetical protein
VTIFAEGGEVATVNFKVVNEFLAVKETAEKIKKQLEITSTTSQDYSSMSSEYNEIVNFRDKFIDQKKYLKTLSDSELKIFNYSDAQIANIRSDDYSDLSLAASSAILTDYIKIDASDTFYDSNLKRFYLRTRAYWSWSGYPIMRNTDKYSAAISGNSIFNYISSIFYVEYTIPGYPTIGKTDSTIVYNANSGIIYKFPLQRNGLVAGEPAIYGYALYGYLDYYAMADYYDEPGLIYSIGSYGHQYVTGTANLSFAPFPTFIFTVGLSTSFAGNKPKCTYDKNLSSGLVTYYAGSWGSGSLYGSCSR